MACVLKNNGTCVLDSSQLRHSSAITTSDTRSIASSFTNVEVVGDNVQQISGGFNDCNNLLTFTVNTTTDIDFVKRGYEIPIFWNTPLTSFTDASNSIRVIGEPSHSSDALFEGISPSTAKANIQNLSFGSKLQYCGNLISFNPNIRTISVTGNGSAYVYIGTNNSGITDIYIGDGVLTAFGDVENEYRFPRYSHPDEPNYINELYQNLTSLTLGNNVTSVGFFGGAPLLSSVNLPSSIVGIDIGAFRSCSALTISSLPPRVKYINQCAFCETNISGNLNIPEGCVTVGHSAFYHTKISSLKIPTSVRGIGDYAFARTNISSVITNARCIGDRAFAACPNLKNVVFDCTNTDHYCDGVIGVEALSEIEHFSNVTIKGYRCIGPLFGPWRDSSTGFTTTGDKLEIIGDGQTLVGCITSGERYEPASSVDSFSAFNTVIYGDGVIGVYDTIYGKSMTLGKDVTTINVINDPILDEEDFIKDVYCYPIVPPSGFTLGNKDNVIIHVLEESLSVYRENEWWGEYTHIVGDL